MSGARARYGVVGWPVEHSRSPSLHNHWLQALELEESYTKFAIPPQSLQDFLLGAGEESRSLRGLNITVPHKEAAARLCATCSPTARRCGAVNTLVRIRGSHDDHDTHDTHGGSWHGENTDVGGFLSVWRELAEEGTCVPPEAQDGLAVVLGSGGVARAALAAFEESAIARVLVVARSALRREALVQDFANARFTITARDWRNRDAALMELPGVVVNATPLGLSGSERMPELPLAEVADEISAQKRAPPLLLDAVYGAQETELVSCARRAGWLASDGRRLLLSQARLSFALWFGVEPGEPPPSFC
ncbi:MAG: shikimate dehydrogenase [Alphaproteobacteria bacterium]